MPARRCSTCGISYPAITNFRTCPIHGEDMRYLYTEPDPDWEVQYERAVRYAATASEMSERHFPLVPGVTVTEEGERFFVDQTEMQRAGARLSRMQPDQFYLFELEDGWIYETQGWDEPRRRWWVERVATAILLPTAEAIG